MTVYVDAARHRTGPRGRVAYCHLTADSLDELHAFAAAIGVKRHWFERSRRGVPHYDLNPAARQRALRAGAFDVSVGGRRDRLEGAVFDLLGQYGITGVRVGRKVYTRRGDR